MITGGNVTVSVSNLDAAIRFYTERLGLRLTNRIGNRWATIEAGPSYWTTDEVGAGLVIGLRGREPGRPAPGTQGAVMFGLETYDAIEDAAAYLRARGVRAAEGIVESDAGIGSFVSLGDADDTPMYLWAIAPDMVPGEDRHGDDGESSEGPTISGGHAVVYVSSMDAAVRFYTEVLGLRLTYRYANHWATVEAGRSLVIGLHPASPAYPPPGTKGATMLGLQVDEPIERVVSRLVERGVRIRGDGDRSGPRNAITIEDPDGNPIELGSGAASEREGALVAAGAPGPAEAGPYVRRRPTS